MINTVFIQKESHVLPYYINNTITTSIFFSLIIQVIFLHFTFYITLHYIFFTFYIKSFNHSEIFLIEHRSIENR